MTPELQDDGGWPTQWAEPRLNNTIPNVTLDDWTVQARCAGMPTDKADRLFFREGNEKPARWFCQGCPVVTDCRTYARANGEEYGVFGGETATERAHFLAQPRRADLLAGEAAA